VPRYKEGILEGSLSAIESNVENERVEVPSTHSQPVFWGRSPKLAVGVSLLYQLPFVKESAPHAPGGKPATVGHDPEWFIRYRVRFKIEPARNIPFGKRHAFSSDARERAPDELEVHCLLQPAVTGKSQRGRLVWTQGHNTLNVP